MSHTFKSPTQAPPLQPRPPFGWVFAGAVVTLNLFALVAAWQDRSFLAFGIAILYGPVGNVLLALLALATFPFVRAKPGFSMARHAALSFGVPMGAVIFDYVMIFSMNLHGC